MASESDIQGLAQWIRTVLQSLQTPDEQILDFARSTFGSDDLPCILTQWDGSETDSLLDLIFYPGAEMQQHFEHRWGAIQFNVADRETIINRLKSQPIIGLVLSPHLPTPFKLRIPPWIPEAFVNRLNITWQPADIIREALQRWQTTDEQIITRIFLRNNCHIEEMQQIKLLGGFIEKMPASSDDFKACLGFLLSILPEFSPNQSNLDFLIAKKEMYFHLYCKAETFERRRASGNMETLMLQGERAAHGSLDQWRQSMRLIDRICHAFFGYVHFIEGPRDTHASIKLQENGGGRQWLLDTLF
jgi:hypothetical protein